MGRPDVTRQYEFEPDARAPVRRGVHGRTHDGDGAAHDYVLQDGDEAEIEGTDVVSGEGETWSLTFTATAEMARYVCTIHPTSMVGSVEVVEA